MTEPTTLATGLRFPEGPIAMSDGSVILVEIAAGRLTRVASDGTKDVVAEPGGGPNGAAIGPDGKCYVCNNGGFEWIERDGRLLPGPQPADYSGGRIERIDIESGAVEVLYEACDGERLKGPNDIVFDATGGFWFTDHGKTRARDKDRTGVFYAKPDGSFIEEQIFPLEGPNGVGLSADEAELYVAETHTGRMWAFPLTEPGKVGSGRRVLAGLEGLVLYDSLAVDVDGNVCVATIMQGGITIVPPDGSPARHFPTKDMLTTNICFGGENLQTAYITLSSLGELIAVPWERPGLPLNFLNK
jgi:gluconolactonase